MSLENAVSFFPLQLHQNQQCGLQHLQYQQCISTRLRLLNLSKSKSALALDIQNLQLEIKNICKTINLAGRNQE